MFLRLFVLLAVCCKDYVKLQNKGMFLLGLNVCFLIYASIYLILKVFHVFIDMFCHVKVNPTPNVLMNSPSIIAQTKSTVF